MYLNKKYNLLIKYIFIFFIIFFLVLIILTWVKKTFFNTIQEGLEGLTDDDRRILNEINSPTLNLNEVDKVNLSKDPAYASGQFNDFEKNKLNMLYTKIGLVSRKPEDSGADDSKTRAFLDKVNKDLGADTGVYENKYRVALKAYTELKTKSKKFNFTPIKNDCKTLNTKIDEFFKELPREYIEKLNLDDYIDLKTLYNSLIEIKIYLNYLTNFNTSSSKFDVTDFANSDFLKMISELRVKLDTILTNINKYIQYPIDNYDSSFSNFINKINNISSGVTKILKDLDLLKLSDLTVYQQKVLIYSITANVNKNYFDNYLGPTIRNREYKDKFQVEPN